MLVTCRTAKLARYLTSHHEIRGALQDPPKRVVGDATVVLLQLLGVNHVPLERFEVTLIPVKLHFLHFSIIHVQERDFPRRLTVG